MLKRMREPENAREFRSRAHISYTHTCTLALTNVAHNFQHITHFEVYASMFKSKGPCKNYHHTTHRIAQTIHTSPKMVRLKLYDYILHIAWIAVTALPFSSQLTSLNPNCVAFSMPILLG